MLILKHPLSFLVPITKKFQTPNLVFLGNCLLRSASFQYFDLPVEKLFDYSCSVELAGSFLGHVPCKFWKVCLGLGIFHRSIMEGNWPALDVVHASVITDLGCLLSGLAVSACRNPSISDQWYGCSYEKSWWSYRARWRCRYLPAFMMVVAGCHCVDFCWANAHLLSSSGAR